MLRLGLQGQWGLGVPPLAMVSRCWLLLLMNPAECPVCCIELAGLPPDVLYRLPCLPVLQGWAEMDKMREKLEDLKELRDLVRSLGRCVSCLMSAKLVHILVWQAHGVCGAQTASCWVLPGAARVRC